MGFNVVGSFCGFDSFCGFGISFSGGGRGGRASVGGRELVEVVGEVSR
jgi:hypothetical protein